MIMCLLSCVWVLCGVVSAFIMSLTGGITQLYEKAKKEPEITIYVNLTENFVLASIILLGPISLYCLALKLIRRIKNETR